MTADQLFSIIIKNNLIPEWDEFGLFNPGDIVFTPNGNLYQALSQNTDKDPLTNPAIWVQIPENFGG